MTNNITQADSVERQLDDLKHKLWNVASHATGGKLGGMDMEAVCAMSINQISLEVTAMRTAMWHQSADEQKERDAALVENHRYADDFLNSCQTRREHREHIAQAIRNQP